MLSAQPNYHVHSFGSQQAFFVLSARVFYGFLIRLREGVHYSVSICGGVDISLA